MERRTDLAMEAREMHPDAGALSGVRSETREENGYRLTTVEVLDEHGEKELCKPIGKYVTLELEPLTHRAPEALEHGAQVLAAALWDMLALQPGDTVLVCGLGNDAVTPDAIGPGAARHTLATRHLVTREAEIFGSFRPVSVLEPGVLGTTGMESAEIIRAVCARLRPDKILAVDALASRRLARVCRTVQLTDTGIVPGSGVANARAALNRDTLGVPVVALGVPTVVDAGTLAADLLEQAGVTDPTPDFADHGGDMVVTPKDIDARVAELTRLLGLAVNLALQPGLTVGDVQLLMG